MERPPAPPGQIFVSSIGTNASFQIRHASSSKNCPSANATHIFEPANEAKHAKNAH